MEPVENKPGRYPKSGKILSIPMILVIMALLHITSCEEQGLSAFTFLTGTWKVEGKEQYEAWVQEGANQLSGHSYGIVERHIRILESLSIRMDQQQIIYEATVPDQNEGKTISFVLNTEIDSCYSFENPGHDFPKKIQYQKRSESEVLIRVLGEEGKGFAYTMIKQ